VSATVWNGEEQPIDTIQDGDPLPEHCFTPFGEGPGGIEYSRLMRWLVPTLTEERAQVLVEQAEARDLRLSAQAVRDFVAEMAPKRV